MLTTIDQFAGQDIWVYAELEYEDAYIRIEKVFDDGTVWYNAWLPSDSRAKYDLDEILYGELTGDVDSIEIHPLDTLTTDELIAKIEADNEVTASKQFTKYPQGYVKSDTDIFAMADSTRVGFAAQYWICDYVMYGLYLGDPNKFKFYPGGDHAKGARKTGRESGYGIELNYNNQNIADPVDFQLTSVSADRIHVRGGVAGLNYINQDMDANTAIQTILNY